MSQQVLSPLKIYPLQHFIRRGGALGKGEGGNFREGCISIVSITFKRTLSSCRECSSNLLVLYCIVLYCIVLYCIVLYCIAGSLSIVFMLVHKIHSKCTN